MKRPHFEIARDDFVLGLLKKLGVGGERSRVGLVIFSDKVKNAFFMSDYDTEDGVLHAIHGENRLFGSTNIAMVRNVCIADY